VKDDEDREAMPCPILQMRQFSIIDEIGTAPPEIGRTRFNLKSQKFAARSALFIGGFDLRINPEIALVLLAKKPMEVTLEDFATA
jgi:hypothetical protein